MKKRLVVTLVGLAISFAMPALAQQQNTVDPEVRQQIEAAVKKHEEAYNKYDAAAYATLYTPDAIEVLSWQSEGGATVGQQAIEKMAAARVRIVSRQTVIHACSGLCDRQRNMRDLGIYSLSHWGEGPPSNDLCS